MPAEPKDNSKPLAVIAARGYVGRRLVSELLRRDGGSTGWFFRNALWRARRFIDRLFGGVGVSRGLRGLEERRTGEAVGPWRVLLAEENHRLTLLAEMKVPGEAVLHFILRHVGEGWELPQMARFLPGGLFGLIYWYAMAPFQDFLFKGMLARVAHQSGCEVLREPEKLEGAHDVCRLPKNWERVDRTMAV